MFLVSAPRSNVIVLFGLLFRSNYSMRIFLFLAVGFFLWRVLLVTCGDRVLGLKTKNACAWVVAIPYAYELPVPSALHAAPGYRVILYIIMHVHVAQTASACRKAWPFTS
jgi:hypothetical protein